MEYGVILRTMDIHITRGGEQHGPYPEASAREMLAAGQLLPTDLAWHAGADGWKPLSEVLGEAQPPATPPPTPPQPATPDAGPPSSPPGGGIPKRQLAGAAPEEEKPAEDDSGDPDKISVTRKGEAIGPYSRDKAKEYFAAGQLLPTDWGWHDGMDEWKPLYEVLDMEVPAQAAFAPAAAAGKPGKGKKVAIIAGIVVLLSGLVFAGITYGPDLVAKMSGASLENSIIGKWKDVEETGNTLEFLEGGTLKIGIEVAGKFIDGEGAYEFISKDRMKFKIKDPKGKTREFKSLVSIEGDTLTLTKIDPNTGKEDSPDKLKRVE